ncbi:MAG: hypothetical protein NT129_05280 [Candidatus Aenigmarchaeota archaeon]|nr:hypothetical protein [Candidatus Aenigmarchaeota archaeon]
MALDPEKIMNLVTLESDEIIKNGGIREGIWKGLEILEPGTNKWGQRSDADGDAYIACPVTVITNKGLYVTEMLAYLGQVTDAFVHIAMGNKSRSVQGIVDRKLSKLEAARSLGINFVDIQKYDDGTLLQILPRGYMPLEGAGIFGFGAQQTDQLRNEYINQSARAESFGFYTKGIVTPDGKLQLALR